ncbi:MULTISPECIES: cytochrome P450 [Catenuloplanes]|uniref:Cytochrome P450 n=1 Tax=Catenuloplanes niger TaxID=587534 RepID=A0AAE4CW06_9ACTN|nr:cytochrome P450 [Catenuloplanes niger]MDR7325992.1 cytochrome P450 [Catenuloplanes niger]
MDYQSALASLFLPEGRNDPYPAYDVLRAHAPVFAADGRWWVTSHTVTNQVLRHPSMRILDAADYDTFWPDWRQNRGVASFVLSMLQTNPPDHSRVRRAAAATFTARRVAAMRDVIAALCEELITSMPAKADFIGAFAYPLPISVICALLGVPAADRPWFRERVADLTVVLEPISTEREMRLADVAGRAVEDYFVGLIAERRRTPQEDLTSALAANGDLTAEELLANLILLLIAGFETTTNLLGTGVKMLMDRPEHAARLRADPGLAPAYVEEILRYDSPVQMTSRLAAEPVEFGGVRIAAGESINMLLGAANRDPERYADPHRFDPDRENVAPVSFGGGAHYCLGAPLARLEAQVALPMLVTMLPALAQDGPEVRRDRLVLRGYSALPVTIG